MPTYNVRVEVSFDYEVEADSAEQAEQEGWNWENYTIFSDVESIDVEEIEEAE